MAPTKIYGPIGSPNVQRALLAAYEHNVDVELVFVDLRVGAHKQAEYLAKNPFGQVPALEDGDVHIFESRGIVRYLDLKHGGSLGKTQDVAKYALVETWMAVEAAQFSGPAGFIVSELFAKPTFFGVETNHAVVEENKKKILTVLGVYEKQLSKHAYLAGDEFTLADLVHIPSAHNVFVLCCPDILAEFPHVKAWSEKILSRPSTKKLRAQVDAFLASLKK